MGDAPNSDVVTIGKDLQAFKWYYTCCCTIIFYEYFLTWTDEIEYAWKGKKSFVFALFLMNRYCPMAFVIITMFAYFSPLWTLEICRRFVIVEWVQTLLIVIPAELILLLRLNALLNGSRLLAAVLLSIILAQIGIVVAAMVIRDNIAMPVPDINLDPFHVCILFSNPKMDTAYLSASITFDSIVFVLTLVLTIREHRERKSRLLRTIQRDGTLYFCLILSGNLTWMFLALYTRPTLKFMNAQPSMILTSVMINRLTLSLRRAGHKLEYNTSQAWGGRVSNYLTTRCYRYHLQNTNCSSYDDDRCLEYRGHHGR